MTSITKKIADEIALHGSWEAYLEWEASQNQRASQPKSEAPAFSTVPDPLKRSTNERGFAFYEFKDMYGAECKLHKSSAALTDAIWLGVKDANPQIMVSDAFKMGLPSELYSHIKGGWIKYPIPQEVSLNTQMHLSRPMTQRLIEVLQQFVDTGEI